jgi:hypothetical protein
MNVISGSAEGRQWACNKTEPTKGSVETQLKFYEYKYIRHILMSMIEFQKKNFPNGVITEHKEPIPYFIYECDMNYVQMLIDKMTKRMEEFEPYISKHTTAHTGYWDV